MPSRRLDDNHETHHTEIATHLGSLPRLREVGDRLQVPPEGSEVAMRHKTFCRDICGVCERCLTARADVEALDAVLHSLELSDADSLMRRDDDDPRTYALDAKGRP